MIKRSIFIVLFFLVSKLVSGQQEEIRFSHIPILDSIVYTGIMDVVQDKDGFMWIFTNNGLYKFDGNKLTTFKPDPVNENSIGVSTFVYSTSIFDSRGNIWTLLRIDRRLELYDKRKNKFYRMDIRSIAQDTPWILQTGPQDFLEDTQQNIWLRTSNSLYMCSLSDLYECMYTGEKPDFRRFVHDPDDPNTISSDAIKDFALDSLGNLLLVTTDGIDVLMYESIKELKVQATKSPIVRKLFSIPKDSSGQPVYRIWRINIDEYQNIWFAADTSHQTATFVVKIDNDEYVKYLKTDEQPFIKTPEVPNFLTNFFDEQFLVTKDKLLIIPYGTEGLSVANLNDDQDPGSFRKYTTENSLLSSNNPGSIIPDKAGNIWITSGDGGVDIIYNTTKVFSSIDEGGHSGTYGICEDHQQHVWFGSWNGLSRFDRKSNELKRYEPDPENPSSISGQWVTGVIEDPDHHLWIATNRGLNVIDLNQEDDDYHFIKFLHNPDDSTSIFDGNPAHFYLDANQDLWIGGAAGQLARVIKPSGSISNCTFENYYIEPYRRQALIAVECITSNPYYESKDILWIGTSQGVYLFNKAEKKSVHLPLPTNKFGSSSPNNIDQIFAENNHTIWLATVGSGLGKIEIVEDEQSKNPDSETRGGVASITINGERFYYTTEWFTEKEGLVDNQVGGIVKDDNGYLWLGTGRGISRFHPPSGQFKNYRETQDRSCGRGSCYKSKTGEIFLGTDGSLIHFHPFAINRYVPPVYIIDFKLFNESVYPGEDSPLSVAIEYTEAIELTYKQNYLSFEFVALNYNHAEHNQYRYHMMNFDRDTIYAGTNHTAEYANLSPGKYRFWVTGSNDDGIWNEEGRSIDIIIHPPWYRSSLAYGSYGILFVISLFGFIRWRTWSLERDKRILEGEVKERTREIEQQKEELQTTNEELQSTLDNLKHTQSQLIQSEKLASLGGLVAGVAHEINTPVGIGVTAVSSLMEDTQKMAELYKKEEISRKDFKEFLQTTNNSARLIQKNLERTAELVQSFKQVSTDQSTEEQREFVFKSYLEDVIRSLYPKFKNRNIEIRIDCDEKLKIDSFPGIFAQIFTNLVLNSINHGFKEDREGVVDINVKEENGNLNIEFKDNGAGIPEEILPKIFDPFFTTDQSKGTGLGLNIVYNLVTQKLQGKIDCRSELDNGAKFIIDIPVSA